MYGVYLNNHLVEKFDNPVEAYEAAKFAYEETGVFHEVRFVVTNDLYGLSVGDRVRHKDYDYFGTGTVQAISKSGKRAYVRWGDDWDRKRLMAAPYGAYYRVDKLEKLDNA